MTEAVTHQTKLVGIVVLFLVLNIIFNAYNKQLFSRADEGGIGLQIPVLATITHAFAGFLLGFTLSKLSFFQPRDLTGTKMKLIVIGISVFFAASIGLNNASLQFLPLSLQQAIRSTAPAAVAVCAVLIEKKKFSNDQIASLAILVIGVCTAVAGNTDNTKLIGLIACFSSVICGALQYTFVSITMSATNRFSSFDLLLYTSLPTVIVLFPAMLANDEISKLLDFIELNGLEITLLYIFLGQLLAVSYNLTVFTFIQLISSVYIAVCGVFKVVLIILFSIIVMGEDVGVLKAVGLLVAMAGFAFNSYIEFDKAQKRKSEENNNNDNDNDNDNNNNNNNNDNNNDKQDQESQPLLADDNNNNEQDDYKPLYVSDPSQTEPVSNLWGSGTPREEP